jgi:hypothetical protein
MLHCHSTSQRIQLGGQFQRDWVFTTPKSGQAAPAGHVRERESHFTRVEAGHAPLWTVFVWPPLGIEIRLTAPEGSFMWLKQHHPLAWAGLSRIVSDSFDFRR